MKFRVEPYEMKINEDGTVTRTPVKPLVLASGSLDPLHFSHQEQTILLIALRMMIHRCDDAWKPEAKSLLAKLEQNWVGPVNAKAES